MKGLAMKRLMLASCLAVLCCVVAAAQTEPYKMVFDLTSRDTLDQKAVLRWIKEVTALNPKTELEVVMYGKGLELVLPERSAYAAAVKEAMANPNVSFKVCEIAMKNNKVEKKDLLEGVQTVPDGIHEIFSKQQDHWGYIKVAH
jgi:intracellular sulfur oxidation DsrE/DsrF family protein